MIIYDYAGGSLQFNGLRLPFIYNGERTEIWAERGLNPALLESGHSLIKHQPNRFLHMLLLLSSQQIGQNVPTFSNILVVKMLKLDSYVSCIMS